MHSTTLPARVGQPSAFSVASSPSPAQATRHRTSSIPRPTAAMAASNRRFAPIPPSVRSIPPPRPRPPPAVAASHPLLLLSPPLATAHAPPTLPPPPPPSPN